MTTWLRRFRWFAMALLALVLASILAFLYTRTRIHDDTSYFENVALLRQLKQLDSHWELDVLKSRMGVNANYDSLVDPLVDLNQSQEKLRAIVADQRYADTGALVAAIEALHLEIGKKTRLIEHFKSQNSVLRNSLVFLPTAADEILANRSVGAAREPSAVRTLAAAVHGVLLNSLVYSQAPSDDKATGIRRELDNLEAIGQGLPASAADGLDIFISHVRVVLREQPVVNELLKSIAAVAVAARIDDLDSLLSVGQYEAEQQARRYRSYLLIFAAALVGLVLYVAASLIRSHAEINRGNKALQLANSTLEQRVQERTRELREAQSELVTTARQAGMAEIANNVLHNVGNVLNSVNVSAGLVSSRMRDSKAQGLTRAVGLMNANAEDLGHFLTQDEKGRTMLAYLTKLDTALVAEQDGIVQELGSLTSSIDHIKQIVTTQQSYAGSSSVRDSVRIQDLLEDALRINASGLTRHHVAVTKECDEIPVVQLDKHLVLQILVNLITNARQAMETVPNRAHRLTLQVDKSAIAAGPRLRIRVQDNGEGIAGDNMARLFAHGFTTRRKGHGFGLHSCVLAAREMGGTLTAHSDGPGMGATFTLELPI